MRDGRSRLVVCFFAAVERKSEQQKLAHHGAEGGFAGGVAGAQALVEGLLLAIVATGGQRGHIQGRAQVGVTAFGEARPALDTRSALVLDHIEAGKRSQLAGVGEQGKPVGFGQQDTGRLFPDAGDGRQALDRFFGGGLKRGGSLYLSNDSNSSFVRQVQQLGVTSQRL